jgi:hypothetical protein
MRRHERDGECCICLNSWSLLFDAHKKSSRSLSMARDGFSMMRGKYLLTFSNFEVPTRQKKGKTNSTLNLISKILQLFHVRKFAVMVSHVVKKVMHILAQKFKVVRV